MFELCLVGVICVWIKYILELFFYLSIVFALLQFFCVLWFTDLLNFLLPEYEDVAPTTSCLLCDELL